MQTKILKDIPTLLGGGGNCPSCPSLATGLHKVYANKRSIVLTSSMAIIADGPVLVDFYAQIIVTKYASFYAYKIGNLIKYAHTYSNIPI